jgi:hypothetical protein
VKLQNGLQDASEPFKLRFQDCVAALEFFHLPLKFLDDPHRMSIHEYLAFQVVAESLIVGGVELD